MFQKALWSSIPILLTIYRAIDLATAIVIAEIIMLINITLIPFHYPFIDENESGPCEESCDLASQTFYMHLMSSGISLDT